MIGHLLLLVKILSNFGSLYQLNTNSRLQEFCRIGFVLSHPFQHFFDYISETKSQLEVMNSTVFFLVY